MSTEKIKDFEGNKELSKLIEKINYPTLFTSTFDMIKKLKVVTMSDKTDSIGHTDGTTISLPSFMKVTKDLKCLNDEEIAKLDLSQEMKDNVKYIKAILYHEVAHSMEYVYKVYGLRIYNSEIFPMIRNDITNAKKKDPDVETDQVKMNNFWAEHAPKWQEAMINFYIKNYSPKSLDVAEFSKLTKEHYIKDNFAEFGLVKKIDNIIVDIYIENDIPNTMKKEEDKNEIKDSLKKLREVIYDNALKETKGDLPFFQQLQVYIDPRFNKNTTFVGSVPDANNPHAVDKLEKLKKLFDVNINHMNLSKDLFLMTGDTVDWNNVTIGNIIQEIKEVIRFVHSYDDMKDIERFCIDNDFKKHDYQEIKNSMGFSSRNITLLSSYLGEAINQSSVELKLLLEKMKIVDGPQGGTPPPPPPGGTPPPSTPQNMDEMTATQGGGSSSQQVDMNDYNIEVLEDETKTPPPPSGGEGKDDKEKDDKEKKDQEDGKDQDGKDGKDQDGKDQDGKDGQGKDGKEGKDGEGKENDKENDLQNGNGKEGQEANPNMSEGQGKEGDNGDGSGKNGKGKTEKDIEAQQEILDNIKDVLTNNEDGSKKTLSQQVEDSLHNKDLTATGTDLINENLKDIEEKVKEAIQERTLKDFQDVSKADLDALKSLSDNMSYGGFRGDNSLVKARIGLEVELRDHPQFKELEEKIKKIEAQLGGARDLNNTDGQIDDMVGDFLRGNQYMFGIDGEYYLDEVLCFLIDNSGSTSSKIKGSNYSIMDMEVALTQIISELFMKLKGVDIIVAQFAQNNDGPAMLYNSLRDKEGLTPEKHAENLREIIYKSTPSTGTPLYSSIVSVELFMNKEYPDKNYSSVYLTDGEDYNMPVSKETMKKVTKEAFMVSIENNSSQLENIFGEKYLYVRTIDDFYKNIFKIMDVLEDKIKNRIKLKFNDELPGRENNNLDLNSILGI